MGNHAVNARIVDKVWSWLVPVAMLVFISFQFFVSTGTADADSEKSIWQSREQFVAIVDQDDAGTSITPNNHPASLSPDQVRNALSSMVLAPNDKHKQLPVFNDQEIDVLSKYISEGLNQASPREDVTFAIVGHFSSFVDFLKVRQVTTGRAFYADGKLNIIFGVMHRDIKENEDRRLNPLTPGSRTRPSDFNEEVMALPGEQPFSKPRHDWVVFTRESMAKPPASATAPAGDEHPQRQSQGATSRQAEAPNAEMPRVKARSPEERLIQLNELKKKQLITDEEYRSKRMEILNDL